MEQVKKQYSYACDLCMNISLFKYPPKWGKPFCLKCNGAEHTLIDLDQVQASGPLTELLFTDTITIDYGTYIETGEMRFCIQRKVST